MREIVFMFFLVIRRKKYLECAWVVTWLRERTPSVISETTSPSFFQVISADGTGGLASLLHVILTSLPFSTFTLTIHRTNWDEDRPRTTRPVRWTLGSERVPGNTVLLGYRKMECGWKERTVFSY